MASYPPYSVGAGLELESTHKCRWVLARLRWQPQHFYPPALRSDPRPAPLRKQRASAPIKGPPATLRAGGEPANHYAWRARGCCPLRRSEGFKDQIQPFMPCSSTARKARAPFLRRSRRGRRPPRPAQHRRVPFSVGVWPERSGASWMTPRAWPPEVRRGHGCPSKPSHGKGYPRSGAGRAPATTSPG